MSSISAGTTSGTALVSTGDTTGTLDLKTGASATTALSIDASQNVGLGVTPSAWGTGSSVRALQFNSGSLWNYSNTAVYLGHNYYFNGTNRIYSNTGPTAEYQLYNGTHAWNIAGSGSAGAVVTFTQAMTLDASGNLGIGTSSPSTKLTVYAGADGDVGFFRGGSTRQLQLGTSSTAGYLNVDNATAGMELRTNGVARAILDNSGNLGLGVTPSGWSGAVPTALQVGPTASFAANSDGTTQFTQNAYYNGSAWKYIASGYSQRIALSPVDGSISFNNAASGAAAGTVTFTQAMTLDASGNLLVGTTSSASGKKAIIVGSTAASSSLWLGNTNAVGSGNAFNAIYFGNGTNGQDRAIRIESYQDGAYSDIIGMRFFTQVSDAGGPIERARIDSSGNLLVGGTNVNPWADTTGTGTTAIWKNRLFVSSDSDCGAFNRIGSDGTIYSFNRSGSGVGSISVTTTATAYNTSSDYRLKENIQPMTGALAKVAALKPVTYKWKADGSDGEGFIAHELAEVCPQAVKGEKDAVDNEGNPLYQGVDTSFLVATLTAAIQELSAKNDELTARIAALESK